MSRWAKSVTFSTRLGPNFLWHVLAVAKIGYESDYAERYRHTLPPRSLEILRANAAMLRFGNGSSGAMTGFFAFLPAWLHLESKSDFVDYFARALQSLQEGSFAALIGEFPDVDWTDRGWAHLSGLRFRPDPEGDSIFAALSDAYLAAYDSFVDIVWPEASIAMLPRCHELNEWFESHDYVAAWERELGIPFAVPSYEIVLCYSNLNGPDYNSLGYSGNLFYYDKPFERTWQFASHEIGTHLLFDVLADASARLGVEPSALHRPFESLAMFYNQRVLGTMNLAYDLPTCNGTAFLSFYTREVRPGITPTELLTRAWQRESELA